MQAAAYKTGGFVKRSCARRRVCTQRVQIFDLQATDGPDYKPKRFCKGFCKGWVRKKRLLCDQEFSRRLQSLIESEMQL